MSPNRVSEMGFLALRFREADSAVASLTLAWTLGLRLHLPRKSQSECQVLSYRRLP